jgi:hypothetical protein
MSRLFLFPLLFLLWIAGCSRGKGEIAVWNKTGQAVREGRLRVGSQEFSLAGLEAGKSISILFSTGDCGPCAYQLNLTLGDGKGALESIGAVRRGRDYRDSLSIEKQQLSLESAQNPSGKPDSQATGSQVKKIKWFY